MTKNYLRVSRPQYLKRRQESSYKKAPYTNKTASRKKYFYLLYRQLKTKVNKLRKS